MTKESYWVLGFKFRYILLKTSSLTNHSFYVSEWNNNSFLYWDIYIYIYIITINKTILHMYTQRKPIKLEKNPTADIKMLRKWVHVLIHTLGMGVTISLHLRECCTENTNLHKQGWAPSIALLRCDIVPLPSWEKIFCISMTRISFDHLKGQAKQ